MIGENERHSFLMCVQTPSEMSMRPDRLQVTLQAQRSAATSSPRGAAVGAQMALRLTEGISAEQQPRSANKTKAYHPLYFLKGRKLWH